MSVGTGSIKRAANAAAKTEEEKTAAAVKQPETGEKAAETKKRAAKAQSGAFGAKKPQTKVQPEESETKKTAAEAQPGETAAKKAAKEQVRVSAGETVSSGQEKRYGIGEELPVYLM